MDDAAHDNDEIFVYTGGDQVVPYDVRRVRIAKSVTIIPRRAFEFRRSLIYVEFHDGIERIEGFAFGGCSSLRSVKLLGVKIVKAEAFNNCTQLMDVDSNKLETIEDGAFNHCTSLRTVTMPCVRNIRTYAFATCRQLTDLEFGEGLETIEEDAFCGCQRLRGIAMPLKDDMIGDHGFRFCPYLATVDLVGGIHNTIASLHMESWRDEMKGEINRINQVLPDTNPFSKTVVIQQWIRSVIRRLNHCKAEHKELLKEATTLLELALWKAKIREKEKFLGEVKAKKAKIDIQSERNERRVTSGANIVIKNVLPYLELK